LQRQAILWFKAALKKNILKSLRVSFFLSLHYPNKSSQFFLAGSKHKTLGEDGGGQADGCPCARQGETSASATKF
jgi:hypothetical protein